jgi:hypothetical protein
MENWQPDGYISLAITRITLVALMDFRFLYIHRSATPSVLFSLAKEERKVERRLDEGNRQTNFPPISKWNLFIFLIKKFLMMRRGDQTLSVECFEWNEQKPT